MSDDGFPTLTRITQWFAEYVASFEPSTEQQKAAIALKDKHCRLVCDEAGMIGAALGLSRADLELARIAGLLHDVARFEQYMHYGTFVDARSINHGERGAEIIGKSGVLADLPADKAPSVIDAARYHNRMIVPDGLPPQSAFMTRLVRDADKLDIFRVAVEYYHKPIRDRAVELDLPDTPHISPAICHSILQGKMALMTDLKSLNDFKLLQMAWVYDVNFAPTLRAMVQRQYLPRIRETLPDLPEVDEVYAAVSEGLARRRRE
jgi:putative nucleotidyltransferase with HDIG domain